MTVATEEQAGEAAAIEAVSAKFDEVFGGAGDDSSTPDRSGAREESRRQEEQESLASLDGAEPEDAGAEADPSLNADESDGDADEGQVADDAEQTPAEASTLDPVLRHAAKRNGWSDGEIDELAEVNPALAERTFQKLHKSYSDLSAQFAKIGQAKKAEASKPAAEASPGDDLLSRIYGEKAEEYAERYGEDFLDEVVKPLAGPMGKMLDFIDKQDEKLQDQEVLGFFKGLPGDLGGVYGTTSKPTEEQGAARQGLAQLADQIRSGAELQGVQMSLSEALSRAVSVHAADHLQTRERQKLASQVKKRSSGITARPTHRTGTASKASKPGDEAATEAFDRKAADLGWSY